VSRCVIIGGADICCYDRIKSKLKNDDFFVCCDSGLRHCESLGVLPKLIVGDFDSSEKPSTDIETIVLPCEKDDTDTFFAVKEAIKRGYTEFLLLGVVGARLDHSLANISILLMLDTKGMKATAIDDYSEMEIVSSNVAYVDDEYSYFSILNISGTAKGITEKNVKYPLSNAEITPDYQYGISNEVITGKRAEISVKEGRLLLIKVY